MTFEEANTSMEVEALPSPHQSPPASYPPQIASPDNILLYDPVEQLYYEVPAVDVRYGEVEVLDCTPVEIIDITEEEEEDVMIVDVLPSRQRQQQLDEVRRRLF